MAVNDFTEQNIQDTYQKVVQTDGVNLADGTGSLLPISFSGNNVIISGSLTAQTYVVSESIINVSSGSTIFGNSVDDTHIFTGSITTSGDISTSGTIAGSNLSGTNTGDQDLSSFVTNSQTSSMSVLTASFATTASFIDSSTLDTFKQTGKRSGDAQITGSLILSGSGNTELNVLGNITASGDISGSGTGSFDTLFIQNGHLDIGVNNKYVFNPSSGAGKLEFNVGSSPQKIEATDKLKLESGDSVIELTGNVTASNNLQVEGNISASGHISSSEADIGGIGYNAGGIVLKNLTSLKANDNTGTDRILAAMNDDEVLLGPLALSTKVRGTNVFFGNSGVGAPATASAFSASGDIIGNNINVTSASADYMQVSNLEIPFAGRINMLNQSGDDEIAIFNIATASAVFGDPDIDTFSIQGEDIIFDAGDQIELNADGSVITMKDASSTKFTFNLGGTPEIDIAGDLVIDPSGGDVTFSDSNIEVEGDIVGTGNVVVSQNITGSNILATSNLAVNGIISGSIISSSQISILSASDSGNTYVGGMSFNTVVNGFEIGNTISDSYYRAGNKHQYLSGRVIVGQSDNFSTATFQVDGDIATDSHITASGDISSSADLIIRNITASGDISSSGTITAEDVVILDDLTIGDDATINGDLITFLPDGGAGPTLRLKDSSNNFFTDINMDDSFHIDFSYHQAQNFAISSFKYDTGTAVDFTATTANSHIFLDGQTGETVIKGNPIYFGNDTDSTDAVFSGNVTASGNINATGFISSSTSKIGLRDLGLSEHVTVGTTAQGDIINHGSTTTIPGAIYGLGANGNVLLAQSASTDTGGTVSSFTGSLFMAVGTDSSQMLMRGMIKGHTAHDGDFGQPLYLSSNGSASLSPPTTANAHARIIGHIISGSGTIYFNPDNTFVKVS